MMHAKVGAGVLLLLFFLGSGASSTPQQGSTADDGEFLRRVMLDLVGYPPSLEQAKAFLADTAPNKRSAKIDELLATDDWADLWTRQFMEVYFGDYHNVTMDTQPKLSKSASARIVEDFRKWFKMKLTKDEPYTEIVRQILDARGSDEGDPALAYKLSCYNGLEGFAVEFANNSARHFMGIRLVCARCHDHPFDKWTVEQYYGMAAFICRQTARGTGGGEKDASNHVEVKYKDDGEMMIPNEEKGGKKAVAVNLAHGGSARPIFLFGGEAGKNDDRMKVLAMLMTGKGNTQLPRALVNRVWFWLFGRGIVHPADDFNMRNRPILPGALDQYSREFVDNKYSIRRLVRAICNSNTYQLSCAADGAYARVNFSRGSIKQLSGEQLLNSISVACSGKPQKSVSHVLQTVASLYAAGSIWCETTALPGNARQALLMRNGSEISGGVNGPVLSHVKGMSGSVEDKIDEMFLSALTRKATDKEKERYKAFVQKNGGWEDAYWTLLNSTEFVTRH